MLYRERIVAILYRTQRFSFVKASVELILSMMAVPSAST